MAEEKEKPLTCDDVRREIDKCRSKGKVPNFSNKEFEEGIELRGFNLQGIILKKACLRDAHLEWADLSGAHLEGADLYHAHLDRANLVDTHFETANLQEAYLEGAVLRLAHLEDADLRYTHLKRADLWLANLEGIKLYGANIDNDTNLLDTHWGNYILGEETNYDLGLAINIYRRLKQWHTNTGMYETAGEFFFREMTAKRKMLRWWPNPFPRAWSKLLSLICGYGERPLRVIASAAVVVLGLALIYFAIGTLTPNTFLNSLYYSAVSFTALGYGQWAPQPEGWVKGLGAFESFIGVFMMALFLITFVRKMTR